MTRVLVLTSLYPPHHLGGAELSCRDVAVRLAERGHDLAVLCADTRLPGVADATDVHEAAVHRRLQIYLRDGELWSPSVRARLGIERDNQAALTAALDAHRPEVVSVWHMGAMSLGLLKTLRRRGIPMVFAACDEWPAYETKLDAWARLWRGSRWRAMAGRAVERITGVPTVVTELGTAGAYLWVSDLTRSRVVANSSWRFPLSAIVGSGIDTRVFPIASAGGRPSDRPWRWQLLYAGRFDPRKGIETVVRALAHLPPQARLRLCGKGGAPEQARLEAIAQELGVRERITFEDLDRPTLALAYRDADAVVFPSEWEEPFGLVPVEAMACGTPVLATRTGGSAEFLFDEQNCLYFPPRDAVALAEALRRLATDALLRHHLVEGGVETARQLDVERLTDVFEAWHAAAAAGYPEGQPAGRPPISLPTDRPA